MITGRKAFEGHSHPSLIGVILKDDPPPLSALQPLAPLALERLVGACLAKDPDDRWQSAGDLKRELGWIREDRQAPPPSRAAGNGRALARRAAIRALAVALLATGVAAIRPWRETTGGAVMRLTIDVPPTCAFIVDAGRPNATGRRIWLRDRDVPAHRRHCWTVRTAAH